MPDASYGKRSLEFPYARKTAQVQHKDFKMTPGSPNGNLDSGDVAGTEEATPASAPSKERQYPEGFNPVAARQHARLALLFLFGSTILITTVVLSVVYQAEIQAYLEQAFAYAQSQYSSWVSYFSRS
jgi:hypothetical protein